MTGNLIAARSGGLTRAPALPPPLRGQQSIPHLPPAAQRHRQRIRHVRRLRQFPQIPLRLDGAQIRLRLGPITLFTPVTRLKILRANSSRRRDRIHCNHTQQSHFSLELFGKFNEETAHQLWELFLKQGGPVAQKLATDHTVIAIFWLLQPGATAGDGAAVAWRFRKTPDELRKLVFDQVNDRLRVRNTTAEAVMLQVFDRLDYEEVRGMPGVVRARQDRSAGPGSRSSHSTRNADGQPRK